MPLKRSDSGDKLVPRDKGRRARSSGLPTDLLAQSARRLYILCLLYAFIFFMAAIGPQLLYGPARALLFTRAEHWAPAAISITVAFVVAALTRLPGIPLSQVMRIGLLFEVVSSFGIAASEFLDRTPHDFHTNYVGLSWVAPWTLLFAVVVPNAPRRTAIATLLSVLSVPLMIAFVLRDHWFPQLTPQLFFIGLVFPYLLVTLMATVGSSVLYSLGQEVARAREMGGYRLVARLGAGGMGEVWRAEHLLLARPAAIKLVRPEALGASDPDRRREMQERFEREAQATALMRSPHTVELYDFGMTDEGTFYYVMELLDGFNLETLVERFGPVPAERAVHLLAQVCHSLGEAHGEGLIHRDIKPANVYVCRYGREVDFVKVLDFGMVKSRRQADEAGTQLTQEHTVRGTPAFMAPEQVLGHGSVDARADLYAVGCLAYWLLTGQLVFTGRTPMEIMTQHAHQTPPRPSSRTELDVPADLDDLVMACLAKDPGDRPASADQVAERLARIATVHPWTAERARAWWDRHHPVEAAGHARRSDPAPTEER